MKRLETREFVRAGLRIVMRRHGPTVYLMYRSVIPYVISPVESDEDNPLEAHLATMRALDRMAVNQVRVDLSALRADNELVRLIDFDLAMLAEQGVTVNRIRPKARGRWAEWSALAHTVRSTAAAIGAVVIAAIKVSAEIIAGIQRFINR